MLVKVYTMNEHFDDINSECIVKIFGKQLMKNKWIVQAITCNNEKYCISPTEYTDAEIDDAIASFNQALFGEYLNNKHPDLYL